MRFEFDQVLKEAFGTEAAKADSAVPGTPYTFANTLEWAVGVQPKKEPSQVVEGTPMAKQFPKEAIQEPGLEEPVLSPLDVIGTGLPSKLGKTALEAGMKQIETGTGFLGKLLPNPRSYIVKTEDNPTWSATSAKGFLDNEKNMSDALLWKNFKTYRGLDGILRQYDYDGNNSFNIDTIRMVSEGIKTGMDMAKFKLSEFLDSPNLYKSFPEFKDIPIRITVNKNISAANKSSISLIDGSFISTPGSKKIKDSGIELEIPHDYLDVNSFDTFVQESLSTLHHELTHASQKFSKVAVSGGSSPEREFISKADYEDLLKIAPKLTKDSLLLEIKRIKYKNYFLMHGETEARGAQGALHLTEQEFNRTVPTVMQKADLKQKAVQLSDFEVNQSNIKTISPEDRINLEWGSDKKYEKAIDKLLKQARKSNFPVEDIPKFGEEELRKRNMLDSESLKGLIIPSLLGTTASLNEGENLDTMGNQSRIIGAEKRKPK
jgi:hypothetical protein